LTEVAGISEFYDLFPLAEHVPGDIWSGLPSHGLTRSGLVNGLLITPACDLANCKTEVLTFLPILPIAQLLRSPVIVADIQRALAGQLAQAGAPALLQNPESHVPPSLPDLEAARDIMTKVREQKVATAIDKAAERALHGIAALIELREGGMCASSDDVRAVLGAAKTDELINDFIRNQRSTAHFLPADGQDAAFSAVSTPSVALLRYPFSVATELLDVAQRSKEAQWPQAAASLSKMYPNVKEMHIERPLKRASVRPAFESDLISRFVGLFGRIGAPDLSPTFLARQAVMVTQ
jgi:hypothetical protein